MPMHLIGSLPVAGSVAENFVLVSRDLTDISLDDFKGKRIILNIFPSLDTDTCAASVRRFNKEASGYDNCVVICVSMDLPFAAARFCVANDIKNVYTGSAFRSDFGEVYGVEIADGPMRGLFARALVVIDTDGRILGSSLCQQLTEEPDYAFVRDLLNK